MVWCGVGVGVLGEGRTEGGGRARGGGAGRKGVGGRRAGDGVEVWQQLLGKHEEGQHLRIIYIYIYIYISRMGAIVIYNISVANPSQMD